MGGEAPGAERRGGTASVQRRLPGPPAQAPAQPAVPPSAGRVVGSAWPAHPLVVELNTWCWLGDLSRRFGRAVTLGDVPPEVWDELCTAGTDAVWLMGVWQRSPCSAAVLRAHAGHQRDAWDALSDLRPSDVVGSAYAIRADVVDAHLGGDAGLTAARAALATRGVRLVLDFVPNHIAIDHAWTSHHPQWCVRGSAADLARDPQAFVAVAGQVMANGRDPYFPAWPDVVQVDLSVAGLRQALTARLVAVAGRCDGVRVDMAMLLLHRVFAATWAGRCGPLPATEFWSEAIGALRRTHPDCLLMAEAYWDTDVELLALGFDRVYDKPSYDAVLHGDAVALRARLAREVPWQGRQMRFAENHDEARLATAAGKRTVAALVALSTLPGVRLWHEGQELGRRIRTPVTLGRRPHEPDDAVAMHLHRRLRAILTHHAVRAGVWSPLSVAGADELVAWAWHADVEHLVVVVNLGSQPVTGRMAVPPSAGMTDLLCAGATVWRDADALMVTIPAGGGAVVRCG